MDELRKAFTLPASIIEGERNETLYRLACSEWAKQDADNPQPADVYDTVAGANAARCAPPLSESEVRALCDHVTNDYPAGPSEDFPRRTSRTRVDADASTIGRGFKVDDLNMSREFAEAYRGRLRYVPAAGHWYAFDGTRWVTDGDGEAARLMRGFVTELLRDARESSKVDTEWASCRIKRLEAYTAANKRAALLNNCRALMEARPEEFDANSNLLNLGNCTLELRPTVAREHRAEDMITKVAGCDYDPKVGHGEWDAHLRRTFPNDFELIQFLRQRMGLALAADTSLHCFYLLYGPTRTGKSTTLEPLARVFGEYHETSTPETFSVSKRSAAGPSPDRAALKGARLVVTSEFPQGTTLDGAFIKKLTGGNELTARGCFDKKPTSFKPCCALVFDTNYLPPTGEESVFSSGRAVVIPCTHKLAQEERDTGLVDRLTAPRALSGILNWMLEGLELYDNEGTRLDPPQSCADAVARYAEASDPVARFVAERCVTGRGHMESGAELWAEYTEFCDEIRERPGKQADFWTALERHGFPDMGSGTTPGRKKARHNFRGIALDPMRNTIVIEADPSMTPDA